MRSVAGDSLQPRRRSPERCCFRASRAPSSRRSRTSLMDQVKSGALPPIAERLPANPLVITPTEKPGQQGGDWNHALVGGGSLSMLVRYQGYEPLVRFNAGLVGPDAERGRELREQSGSHRIHLPPAQGQKWSDGQPYTTADVQFWYEDIYLNKDVSPGGMSWWKSGGKVGKLEVVDEVTFKVTFAAPNGFFVQQLAWAAQDYTTLHAEALPQAVPHQVQPRRRQARQGARAGELDRAVPARDRRHRRQHLLFQFEAARR